LPSLIREVRQIDIAPTIAKILGFSFTCDGEPIGGILVFAPRNKRVFLIIIDSLGHEEYLSHKHLFSHLSAMEMRGLLFRCLSYSHFTVIFVDESYTSSSCPMHGNGCGGRISRGLFRCTRLNKVLNADIVAAYNILIKAITPSPNGIGVMGRRPGPGLNKKNVAPNLPALATPRTLAL